MIKKLAQSLREYKKPTILTLIFITGEVFFEVLIPFFTADLVNAIKAFSAAGQEAAGLHDVVKQGLLLVAMAVASLGCGSIAAVTCSKASSGYAKNLRHDMFARIQNFSFENIDRFSSASLVTRMTTDISNVQMSFMMLIRMAVRSPLMFLFAVIMAFIMGGKLALTFVIVIPVLVFGLFLIAKKAMPAFHAVFKKYDRLNESIEENVRAMRVVKGFAREDYEKDKFGHASRDICKDFTYAERVVALNNPLMQLCIYFNMIFILTVGSKLIITSGGTLIDTGEGIVTISFGSRNADKTYATDPTGIANNEDSYTMHANADKMQNDRVLGNILLTKVDLDAARYLAAGSNGDTTLEGAVYDLYAADTIEHPDGVSGIVDYSKITDANGTPIWHTTVLTNGSWDTDYLPILQKDRLIASAKITDGKLAFANLYMGRYYLVERATGLVLPIDGNGKLYVTGKYPQLNKKLERTGKYSDLARKNNEYNDYIYGNHRLPK